MNEPLTVEAMISHLPPRAARMAAIEILLADRAVPGDDTLESGLYILRENLRARSSQAAFWLSFGVHVLRPELPRTVQDDGFDLRWRNAAQNRSAQGLHAGEAGNLAAVRFLVLPWAGRR